ncbi:alkylation response protein AidB-like acyl-CoA dehydrogenase [Advenella incenata]|uniref:Alkylation response protein AidB-like acyl-CoA dehydrogenase n=1 Tax=Advenella incenata TaxID=267800 RepID=A0A4V2FTL9_9BURK|nr:acyl-CoA dehydrogenase family protein [Advenella incenata]RZT98655.1 alkylation response protein AidB-like acyl-CoA dehydrogenase [Advenella incenata]
MTDETLPQRPEAFRAYVRAWMAEHYAQFQRDWPGRIDPVSLHYRRAWEDTLCRHGWSGLGWPPEYGGKALPLSHQAIYLEELARSGAPLGVNLIGHGIFSPTLLHFGSPAQKARYLPGILRNEAIWCQGYSEPGAGSDLAAVTSRARKTDSGYVLDGHKIWTSFANLADYCFALVRTDPNSQRHRGLSFLLVDMRQPGVRVEPIRQLTGEAEFCEVFFEQVNVPSDCLLGQEGDGWRMAMAAASFERGTYFIPRLVQFEGELGRVRGLIDSVAHGLSPISLQSYRQRWAALFADSMVLQLKSRRALLAAMNGDPPGPEGSSTKVHWSEAHQRMLDLALELLGLNLCAPAMQMQAEAAFFAHASLWSRAETILAGTSEIQRNIIGEKVLGLAKG